MDHVPITQMKAVKGIHYSKRVYPNMLPLDFAFVADASFCGRFYSFAVVFVIKDYNWRHFYCVINLVKQLRVLKAQKLLID